MSEPAAGPPRWRRSLKNLLFSLLLAGAGLLVALGLAELLVRLVAPQQLIVIRPGVWQPADSVGYLFQGGLATRINTGERTVDLFTDSAGFRVGAAGRPRGEFSVLLLGDSFMAALQVQHEESLAGLIESELPRLVEKPVAVWNGGVSGWGPSEYFYRANSLLDERSFDLVIVTLFVGNDAVFRLAPPREPVVPRVTHRFSWPASWNASGLTEAFLRPLNDLLETNSHLFIFLRKRLKTLLMRLGLAPEYFPREYLREESDSPRWRATADIAARIADRATEAGSRILFVLIPAEFQVDSAAYQQYLAAFSIDPLTVALDQPSELLYRELADRGIPTVDVLEHFRQAHARGLVLNGKIDRHLSPQGHRVLWQVLEQEISRLMAGETP